MYAIEFADYSKARPVFRSMEIHGAVDAVLGGRAAGVVYVDDRQQPKAALVQVEHRFYLAGAATKEAFNTALGRFFTHTVVPQARTAGTRMYVLYYTPDDWAPALDEALASLQPIKGLRHCYAAQSGLWQGTAAALLPGYTLRAVDEALLAETNIEHLDDLRHEMCSEHATVDEFVKKSFGVCVVRGNELAGWCLSEYNDDKRCEVGIETVSEHQRCGLGTAMTVALVERAFARGITEVGWHCYASNAASIATARKASLVQTSEYPVYLGFHDEGENLAMHGGIAFEHGRHAEALQWFEKAFERDAALARATAPNWAYMLAARAAAVMGGRNAALRYLARAIDRGFVYLEIIQNTEELQGLHDTPEWKKLIARLVDPPNSDSRAGRQ